MGSKAWWFPTAFSSWGDEERGAIDRVMTSGRYTQGEEVAAFEREFADFHGMRHGVMCNSGSSANLLMTATLFNMRDRKPLKRGDFAAVPALAWSTTYAPLVQHGLELTLLDCGPDWNVDPYRKDFDLGEPRLIVGCSILGSSAPLRELQSEAGVHDAYFVEDNCESAGAIGDTDDLCGTFGLMSSFSFFYSHQISAIEGGMVLTNDDECAMILRMLRSHGWTRDIVNAETVSFENEYTFLLHGYNVRGLELHAAIAREQLRKLPAFTQRRRANLSMFHHLCSDLPIELPQINGEPNPFGLHFLVKDADKRSQLAAVLRENHIDCRLPTGGSLRLQPYGERWSDQWTPGADRVHVCGMFLGNGPVDLSEQIEATTSIMRQVLT